MSEFRRKLLFIKKNKEVSEFIATYNVNITSIATQLFGDTVDFNINQVKKMYINDIEITPTKSYRFQQVGTYIIRCVMDKDFNFSKYMFFNCTSLVTLDFSNVDTRNVTEMQNMFQGCNSLVSVNLSNIDTSNVIYLGNTFNGCTSLTSLDLSNFDTSNVKTLNYTFTNCTALTSLDLSSWDIKNISLFNFLFDGCTSLISLNPMRNWTIGNIDLSFSPIQALSIHQLLENAVSIKDGAKHKILTLNDYTLYNIKNSEYYLKIIKNAVNKNIEIGGMDMDNIVVPETITSIPENALRNLTNIKSIKIPSTVTYIGDNAFSGCVNISTIEMNPTTAPTLGENVWGNNESNYVGSNVSYVKFAFIKNEYIGYDTDKWNVLFEECLFIKFNNSIKAIGSNGSDYLVLDYKPNRNTIIRVEYKHFNTIGGSEPFIDAGDWANATSKTNRFTVIARGQGNKGLFVAIGDFIGTGAPLIDNDVNKKTFFNIDMNTFTITTALGTTDLSKDLDVTGFTSSDFLHIFKRNDTNEITPNNCIFVYRISVIENNTSIAEYLPFKDDKGNGLINVMNNTKFYGAKGTKFIEEL